MGYLQNMNISDTKLNIFESEDFVISELKKMQTLFQLKKEIRYAQTRTSEADTESVAEHIYGMHCLMDYFQPLENEKANWDQARIRLMIQYHDIDEIETGDTIGYLKSVTDHKNERNAAELVIEKLPETTKKRIRETLNEYERQETPESRFVKALDKIEPIFHLYNEAGKRTLVKNKTTKDQSDRIKFPHMQDFPIIKRFTEVMTVQFEKEDFYHEEA